MKAVNYDSIKSKIDRCLQAKFNFALDVKSYSKEEEFKELSQLFCDIDDESCSVESLRRIYVDKYIIHIFDTKNLVNGKVTNYITCTSDDLPLFLVSHSEKKNTKVKYVSEIFSIYDPEKYDENRYTKYGNGNFLTSRVYKDEITFDTTRVEKYYSEDNLFGNCDFNDYEFYFDNDEHLACDVNGSKYVEQNRFDLAFKRINRILGKIDNEIDDRLEYEIPDDVKIYVVKKKEKLKKSS